MHKEYFFPARQLKYSTGMGLFQCLEDAMCYVGKSDWKERLVGYGCDGASAIMAAGCLRGHLEHAVLWVVMFWCLAHRLEFLLVTLLKIHTSLLLMKCFFSCIIYKKNKKSRIRGYSEGVKDVSGL